jgi:hypothetical protein
LLLLPQMTASLYLGQVRELYVSQNHRFVRQIFRACVVLNYALTRNERSNKGIDASCLDNL